MLHPSDTGQPLNRPKIAVIERAIIGRDESGLKKDKVLLRVFDLWFQAQELNVPVAASPEAIDALDLDYLKAVHNTIASKRQMDYDEQVAMNKWQTQK